MLRGELLPQNTCGFLEILFLIFVGSGQRYMYLAYTLS